MSLDEKGHKISKSHLAKFEKALADFSQNRCQYKDIDPRFLDVHENTLKTQIERLKKEINSY